MGKLEPRGGGTSWEIYLAPSSDAPKEQAKQVHSGQKIKPGQQIGFRLFPKKEGHYMIIGKDEKSGLYLGAPSSSTSPDQQYTQSVSLPTPPSTYVDLQEALEFDDQLGTETLFLCYCQKSMSFQTIRKALELDASAPSLSKTCQVTSFTLVKAK